MLPRKISDKALDNGQQSLAAPQAQRGGRPGGLSSAEAAARLAQYGSNVLDTHRERTLILEFLSHFRNPLVVLLLVASSISALTGNTTSFLIISVIVLMSVILDFVQEYRAGQAVERLKHAVIVRATVLRDGTQREVPVSEIVPNDVVLLSAGDLIPADGQVVEAKDFFVNQALLTGEPYPVEKHPGEHATPEANVESTSRAVFMGTSMISGTATVLVCRTGAHTALGEIAETLSAKAPPTAFELGIRSFGLLIMRLTILLVLLSCS